MRNQPAIRLKWGEILYINKKVFFALDCPEHICFWWDKSQKVLLVAAEEETALSFKVGKGYYTTGTGFKTKRKQFLQVVMNIAGWDSNMIYVVIGEYIPSLTWLLLDLTVQVSWRLGMRLLIDVAGVPDIEKISYCILQILPKSAILAVEAKNLFF